MAVVESSPRKLVAVLAADIAGYSKLMGEDDARTVADLKANQAVVIPMIVDFSGRLIDTAGDGILAEFSSVVNALECGIAMQRALAERNASIDEARRMWFRLGVNIGDVIYDEERIYGDGVNVAARLEGLADPGGICISANVFEQVRGKLDFVFEDLGPRTLKNIHEPVQVFKVRFDVTRKKADQTTEQQETSDAFDAIPTFSMGDSRLTPGKSSIAVLPLENLSGDPQQDFIGDGLATDIIAGISRIRTFDVISRNSTFQYKSQSPDARRVSRELSVQYVLEGNVRIFGDKVRVSVQLIEATSGKTLWAERYDEDLVNVFEIQENISIAIVAQLEPEIHRVEYERVEVKHPELLGAWELFHKGLYYLSVRNLNQAKTFFSKSIELDDTFAPPYAGLSRCHFYGTLYGADPDASYAEAAALAQKAVNLDDRNAYCHVQLSFAYAGTRDLDNAIYEAQRAIQINPSSSEAYQALGTCLTHSGSAKDAITNLQRAISLSPRDPQLPFFQNRLAHAYLYNSEYDNAIRFARIAIASGKVSWPSRMNLASALAHAGQIEKAKLAIDGLKAINPEVCINYIIERVPTVHEPYMRNLLDGLRKAGLSEN